jgi:hypothetical protein
MKKKRRRILIILGLLIFLIVVFFLVLVITDLIMDKKTNQALHEIYATGEVMYPTLKGTVSYGAEKFIIGSVNHDGSNSKEYPIYLVILKPTWSEGGNILFYLDKGPAAGGYYAGYPAYWDAQTNEYKKCTNDITLKTNIESADNPKAPYEVLIQGDLEISRYDIETCTQKELLLDTSTANALLIGFSYFHETNELVYAVKGPFGGDTPNEFVIKKVDLDTKEEVTLAEGINPKWSPDGSMISYIGPNGVYIMNKDGSHQQCLWTYPFGDRWKWDSFSIEYMDAIPHWSPDGKWLTFHVKAEGETVFTIKDAVIYSLSIGEGTIQKIATGGVDPVWIP